MNSSGEGTPSSSPTMENLGEQRQADLRASVNSNIPLNPPPLLQPPPSPPKTLAKIVTTPPPFNNPLNSPQQFAPSQTYFINASPPPPTITATAVITPRTVPATSPLPSILHVDNNEQNYVNNHIDHEYFDSFPPGYRFCPFDEELVVHYLKNKVTNQPLPRNKIMEVNLYHYNPEILAARYKQYGEKEWYFFTPRDKKYRNGSRPNRAAGDGYWKATGADKQVKYKGAIVGFRKALVFYKGKPPRGDKTNWIMHEYRVNEAPPRSKRAVNDMRLDDWVLCRIYKKAEKPNIRNRPRVEEGSTLTNHNDANIVSSIDGDCDSVNSTGYLNTFHDDYVQPPLPIEFSEVPQVNNFPVNNSFDNLPVNNFDVRFNDQFQALSGNSGIYGTTMTMAEPMYTRNLHFATRYRNQSWSLRPPRLQDDFWSVSNFGNSDIAGRLDSNGTNIEGFDNVDNLFAIDSSNPPSNLSSNPPNGGGSSNFPGTLPSNLASSFSNSGSNLPSNPTGSLPNSTTRSNNFASNPPSSLPHSTSGTN